MLRPNSSSRLSNRTRRQAGFNLLELLVILALVGLIAILFVPDVLKTVRRTKMESAVESIRNTLSRARSEAVRRGENITVTVDIADNELVTTDSDGDVLARFQLPEAQNAEGSIQFWGAADPSPGGANAVTGFAANQIVFGANGAADSTGSLFIGMGPSPRSEAPEADFTRNFLETRLAVASTPRIEIRKWVPSSAAYELKSADSSGSNWEWY